MGKKRCDPIGGMLGILPPYANVKGWCQLSGMTPTRTYDLLAINLLRGKKLGGSTIIDVWHGLAYLRSLPDYQPELAPNERVRRTVAPDESAEVKAIFLPKQ